MTQLTHTQQLIIVSLDAGAKAKNEIVLGHDVKPKRIGKAVGGFIRRDLVRDLAPREGATHTRYTAVDVLLREVLEREHCAFDEHEFEDRERVAGRYRFARLVER
jgi:hypothetical protein